MTGVKTACLLLALALAVCLSPGAAPAADPRKILILHSYNVGQVWTEGVMRGMQEVLSTRPDLSLHVEYMDTKRYHEPEYLKSLLELVLDYKLKSFSFDLVLLSDNDAFEFAKRHRHDLFLGTPIVFCGVNNFQPEMIAGLDDITGVAEFADYRGNLELILRLHPNRPNVIVIGNTRNETDIKNRQLLMAALPEFSPNASFEMWDNVTMTALKVRLPGLGSDSIVLINGLVLDEAGRGLLYGESTERIHALTSAPLYAFWEFFLGHGIVGGHLVSAHRQGHLAANLALEILAGKDPDEVPVITAGADEWLFDYRELQRFGISRKALPEGSEIRYRPPPFFSMTKREAYTFSAVAGLLFLTIAALAFSILRVRTASRQISASEERFRAISDFTYDWESWIGPDGRLIWVNPSVQCHTGFSVAECLQMADYPTPIMHEDDRSEAAALIGAATRERTSAANRPLRIRRKDGDLRWMAASWQPIRDSRGEYAGIRMSLRDITEMRETEAKLRDANEELDSFVRTVSHDLRTPLTPLIGYAELLRRKYSSRPLDEEGQNLLASMESQGRRMSAMLEDLLALARVGHLEPPEEPIHSGDVVRDILSDLEPQLAGRSVRIGPLPSVAIPRAYLQQALENLLTNAVRYGGEGNGGIEVSGERRGHRVRFRVRDHGPGVPDEEKERIFDLFYRGRSSRNAPGTGVGLATVRRIAHRCNGRLWVEDTPGGGSTFILEIEG